MKRNIIILSVLSFLFCAALMYLFVEILYKERTSDKINSAIDNVEMLSSLIDTLK